MNKLDRESIIGISALLVHAANIDEIYSEHEKGLVKDFINSYLKDVDANEILKKAEIIESIPENEELTVYHHGDTWYDLCRGPHLLSSGKIGKAFKLTKVAGAYWRGDSKNDMLQRIYGTGWATQKE